MNYTKSNKTEIKFISLAICYTIQICWQNNMQTFYKAKNSLMQKKKPITNKNEGVIIMNNRHIYMDHAATTPVSPEVLEAMLPYFTDQFGNASSIYAVGRQSKKALEESREKVAKVIGVTPREIFFTGSGTEADNWAIKGVAYANKGKENI